MAEETSCVESPHKACELLAALFVLESSCEDLENLRFEGMCGIASINAPLLVLPESDMDRRSVGDVAVRFGELVKGINLISSMFLLCALFVCNNCTINFPLASLLPFLHFPLKCLG